ILHQELAAAHHAEARTHLVPKLPLNVVEDFWNVTIALGRAAKDLGDLLLVGGTVEHLALVSVLDAQHLLAVVVVAAALLPELRRLNGGHQHFLRARPVLLLAHDLPDLLEHAKAQREPGIDAGARLPDHAGAQHEPMRDDLRLRRVLANQRQEVSGKAHARSLLGVFCPKYQNLARTLGRRGRAVHALRRGLESARRDVLRCDKIMSQYRPSRTGEAR